MLVCSWAEGLRTEMVLKQSLSAERPETLSAVAGCLIPGTETHFYREENRIGNLREKGNLLQD